MPSPPRAGPGLGVPVPESISVVLPPIVTAVTVNGIGTMFSASPAALSAACTSASAAFFTKSVLQLAVPDAVVDLRDLDVADLELHEALFEQRRIGLSKRRSDELERPVQAEGGPGRCRGYYEPTAGYILHCPLPSLLSMKPMASHQ